MWNQYGDGFQKPVNSCDNIATRIAGILISSVDAFPASRFPSPVLRSLSMPNARLKNIVSHCDRLLHTEKVKDYDRAANGLQVENSGSVIRLAAAVDASLATVRMAIAAKADLLLVHHGLFWAHHIPGRTNATRFFKLS